MIYGECAPSWVAMASGCRSPGMPDDRTSTKNEPPPTRGVNRDSGTNSANGGWLRRLRWLAHGFVAS